MKKINPNITRFPKATLKKSPPKLKKFDNPSVLDGPRDQLDLTDARKEVKRRKSFGRKVMEAGLYTTMGISAVAGIVGGGAVATNVDVVMEAMNQDQPVTTFAQDFQNSQKADTGKGSSAPTILDLSKEGIDLSQLPQDLDLQTESHSAQVSLSGEKTQAVVNHFSQSGTVQEGLTKQLKVVEGKVYQAIQRIDIKGGETLLTARVPFPSGDGSLVQIAGVDVPVGLNKLELEELPLVISYEVDPIKTGLQVDLKPANVERAPLPEGAKHALHLSSIRAEITHPEQGNIPISGRVKLSLDDGAATQRAMDSTNDPAKKAALGKRLEQIKKIQKLGKEQNLDSILDSVTREREIEFSGHLQGTSERMGDGTLHAWLTPDQDGDQRGDIQLTGELHTAAVDDIQFIPDQIKQSTQTKPEGRLEKFIETKISETIDSAAHSAIPKVLDGLRGTVQSKIQERFQTVVGKIEGKVDGMLDQSLDAVDSSLSDLGIDLKEIDIDAKTGDLVASINSESPLKEVLGPKIKISGQPGSSIENKSSTSKTPSTIVPIAARSKVQPSLSKPSVIIPGSSAREFLGELIEQPAVQEAFDSVTAETRSKIESTASNISGPSGKIRVDVDIPFPSNQQVDSPLGGISKLARKNIPFTAKYQVDDFGLDLKLDIQPVEVEEAVRPEAAKGNGVFLGAVKVGTGAMKTTVSGNVQLQKHQTQGGAPWAETALKEAFDQQDFGFQGDVSVGETESLFYVWVVPDHTGDGKADIAVAHRSLKSGAEDLKIGVSRVTDRTPSKDGSKSGLGQKLNGVVGQVIQDQIIQSGDKITENVAKILQRKVGDFLQDGSNQASAQLNGELSKLYSKIGKLEVPIPAGMQIPGADMSLKLGNVNVIGDNIVSEYSNQRLDSLSDVTSSLRSAAKQTEARPGELQAHVPGAVFNRLLADKSDGGSFDWNHLFDQAADKSNAIQHLKLAENDQGKPISPSIRMVDGRPTLTIQVDGQTNGIATPVSGGLKLLPGFVGDGLGWISDNTVGKLLGSRLQTEIQVPLELDVQDGKLDIGTGEVKFASPREKDFNIVDILPTRMLSSLITDGVAEAMGPEAVNKLLEKADVDADLSEYGVEWTRADLSGEEGKVPNLTVGVTIGKDLSGLVEQASSKIASQGANGNLR